MIEEARTQGRPTVALTNVPSSPLGSAVDEVLALEAGVEQSVAATKTYVNSLGAIALLFAASTGDQEALAELETHPCSARTATRTLAWRGRSDRPARRRLDGGTVIARGVNYGTSFEIALKIRELSGLLFEAYSAADLMHGPVAAIAPGWPVIAGSGALRSGTVECGGGNARRSSPRAHGQPSLLPTTSVFFAAARFASRSSRVCPSGSARSLAVVPGQIVALRLAQLRGSLAKLVCFGVVCICFGLYHRTTWPGSGSNR